jgi:hypothetical protein
MSENTKVAPAVRENVCGLSDMRTLLTQHSALLYSLKQYTVDVLCVCDAVQQTRNAAAHFNSQCKCNIAGCISI